MQWAIRPWHGQPIEGMLELCHLETGSMQAGASEHVLSKKQYPIRWLSDYRAAGWWLPPR